MTVNSWKIVFVQVSVHLIHVQAAHTVLRLQKSLPLTEPCGMAQRSHTPLEAHALLQAQVFKQLGVFATQVTLGDGFRRLIVTTLRRPVEASSVHPKS